MKTVKKQLYGFRKNDVFLKETMKGYKKTHALIQEYVDPDKAHFTVEKLIEELDSSSL